MNKILLGVNALLVAAVAFLFFKVNSLSSSSTEVSSEPEKTEEKPVVTEPTKKLEQVGNTPTGKIAFVNIDKLNDESLEISDLVAETKRRRTATDPTDQGTAYQSTSSA